MIKQNLNKYKITDAQIDPFGYCNAKCWFCPVRYQKNPPHAAKHMSLDLLDKIFSELIKEKEKPNGVYDFDYTFGNIKDSTLEQIWRSDEHAKMIERALGSICVSCASAIWE